MNRNKQGSQQNIKSQQSQKRPPPVQQNQRNAVQGRQSSPNPKLQSRNAASRQNNNANNSNSINSEGSNSLNPKGLRPTQAQQKQNQIQNNQIQQGQQQLNQHQINQINYSNQSQHFQGIAQELYQEEYSFGQINNLIHEYLLKNNLTKTLETFSEELTQPLQPYDQSRGYEFQLMEHFKKGERDLFFKKWNRFLPLSLLIGDEKVTKLEFYLQIFFFIFPIHPFFKRQQNITQESINSFKEYLDNRGAELSKSNEFLHYYALPYIPRPQEHQALQHLFTSNWIENLRYQLNEFLASLYDNQPLPLLFYIYQSYLSNNMNAANKNEINTFAQQPGGILNTNSSNNMFSSPSPIHNPYQKQQIKLIESIPMNINNSISNNDYDQSLFLKGGNSQINVSVLQNENRELVNIVKQFNEKYMMLQNQNRIVSEQNKQIIIESHQKWIITGNELLQISKNVKYQCFQSLIQFFYENNLNFL